MNGNIMTHWTDKYAEFMHSTFGKAVPSHLGHMKLHSIYPEESEWFQRSAAALFEIELAYVQELINELADRKIQGAFVEFGIYQGTWIRRLAKMTKRAKLKDRLIWGFDSFKGLSQPHPTFDVDYWKEGMYAASRADVEKKLGITYRRRVRLVEGYFSESLRGPEAAALGEVAFARIDCDIYQPTVECLEFLSTRLANEAVLVFDDWSHNIDHGEARAFAEWIPTVPHLRFEFLALGVWDHLYVRVLHRT
jgi:Macrocin-O-methyltransferase (TylF)